MKSTIAVAISGGVDSLMAASLLRDQGHRVFGIHFRTGYDTVSETAILQMVKQMDIPVRIVDCTKPFQSIVIDYFAREYLRGRTPNPCLICNPGIKFGLVFNMAMEMGATHLATGHYAQTEKILGKGHRLLKGSDLKKDQSYFLSRLSPEQLARAVFPLGRYTKDQIKQMASERGFQPASHSESQDICFIRNVHYGEFLMEYLNQTPSKGPIVDTSGRQIGVHNGLHLFTIGQRRGINCPASEPYYVVRLDPEKNRLIVGFKSELLAHTCRVVGVNWINKPERFPANVQVRVRYRHPGADATIVPTRDSADITRITVHFDAAQAAITPGQGAVFYQGAEVLGGGWIAQ